MKYRYELMCPSKECEYRSIKIFSGIKDAAESIGTIVECCECGEEFQIEEEHIFVRKL